MLTLPVGVVPALVVLPFGREHGRKVVMPFEHQLDMAKAHVRAVPVRPVAGAAFSALRGSRGRKGVRCLEMGFANQCGLVASSGQGTGKAFFTHLIGQIDAVVGHTMGSGQQAGQDGRARGLANQVGRDASLEPRSCLGHFVQVRRLHVPAFKAVAVCPLLIGRDENDVGPLHRLIPV